MTTASSPSLREMARRLPLAVREARITSAQLASDAVLLRAVVSAGVGAGEWRSTTDAARAFVVDDRTLRRWLADDALALPGTALRSKLMALAFAFAVEVRGS